jgi:hypothetical protein
MSPEEYAALKAAASIKLVRDQDGNYIYAGTKAMTGVLPRDIIEQLEQLDKSQQQTRDQQHTDIITFIEDLKAAK